MLGPENERNTILETSKTLQPMTEHNILEDLNLGSDLSSWPRIFSERTSALILYRSVHNVKSHFVGFVSFPTCKTIFILFHKQVIPTDIFINY
jgi:hypothetical protein